MKTADEDFLNRIAAEAADEIMTGHLPNRIVSGSSTAHIKLRDFRIIGAFEGMHACATFRFWDQDIDDDLQAVLEATIMALDQDAWKLPVEEADNDELIEKATIDGRIVAAALVIGLNDAGEELILLFHSPFISPGTAVVMLKNSLTKGYRAPTGLSS